MSNLTWKDWAIIGLSFVVLLVTTPLVGLVDETPLESLLPPALGVFGALSFYLSFPVIFVTTSFGLSGRANLNVVAWLTAILYSAILAFVLSWLNKRVKKDRHQLS